MKDNHGFTLIELTTVIIILSIILVLVANTFIKTLSNSKEQAYQLQISLLESSSKKWAIENPGLLSKTVPYCLTFQALIDTGNIKDSDIVDPRDNSAIPGYIKISYDEAYSQYEYKYVESCP